MEAASLFPVDVRCTMNSLGLQMALFGIGYMRVSRKQERQWMEDPEEFIQDEDELCIGPRASGK